MSDPRDPAESGIPDAEHAAGGPASVGHAPAPPAAPAAYAEPAGIPLSLGSHHLPDAFGGLATPRPQPAVRRPLRPKPIIVALTVLALLLSGGWAASEWPEVPATGRSADFASPDPQAPWLPDYVPDSAQYPKAWASMNAALRRTLGWIAAVLLNVGAILFVIGLIVPHGQGGVPLWLVGAVLCVVGLAFGGAWMLVSRR